MEIHYCYFDTPIGTVYVAETQKGICKLSIDLDGPEEFESLLKEEFGFDPSEDSSLYHGIGMDIQSFLRGKEVFFTHDLDFGNLTEECVEVLKCVSKLKYGEKSKVSRIAEMLNIDREDREKIARIKEIIAENPIPIIIPCHRVVDLEKSRLKPNVREKLF